MHRSAAAILTALALLAGSCASSPTLPDDALVLMVSSDLSVGHHRVAVGALSTSNESLVTDDPITIEFFRPNGSTAGAVRARFMWAIPDVRALWVSEFDFDIDGVWSLGVRDGDGNLVMGQPFAVSATSVAVAVGEVAPLSETKTLVSNDMDDLTSDSAPDVRFYEQTVAEAVTSGRPTVIVFATPAFCTSATCGPSLDVAKGLIDEFSEVNWVHVEVFDNLGAESRDELVVVPAVAEWGLQTEPWVFVVDADGLVRDRLEGAADETAFREALEIVIPAG